MKAFKQLQSRLRHRSYLRQARVAIARAERNLGRRQRLRSSRLGTLAARAIAFVGGAA